MGGGKHRPADHTEDSCFSVEEPGVKMLHILKIIVELSSLIELLSGFMFDS